MFDSLFLKKEDFDPIVLCSEVSRKAAKLAKTHILMKIDKGYDLPSKDKNKQ
jgi:hypothetical protein